MSEHAINCNVSAGSTLTFDNLLLSNSQNHFPFNQNEGLQRLHELLAANISDATKRAYKLDMKHFMSWGGCVPCAPEQVALYLSAYADVLSVSTLGRRVSSIRMAHLSIGLLSPTDHPLVRATLRGIRRTKGRFQRRAAALSVRELQRMLSTQSDGLLDVRDRALILIGFAGALRRSELVALDLEDVSKVERGLLVRIRRGKTDQEGIGREIAIPFGRTQYCPVDALNNWIDRSKIHNGPLFRPISRHSQIKGARLSSHAVGSVIKKLAFKAGMDFSIFSGHSLRAGLATSAASAGVSSWKIKAQTGHRSDSMLSRYIRHTDLFVDNAAAAIL